jgi:large subunit ribosomal protein L6
MSRIGKRSLTIPKDVIVEIKDDSVLTVKGPLATLTKKIHPFIKIEVSEGSAQVSPLNTTGLAKALWGTYASHLKNMTQGVVEPYTKKLILDGVGYRMQIQNNVLILSVGYSHPVEMTLPEGVKGVVEKNELTLSGSDKEVLGQFAANVRSKKKPEPYKGKGFHYSDEVILRKQGKKAS